MTRTIDDAAADRLGERLDVAYRRGDPLDPDELSADALTVADGYAIQRAALDRRENRAGPTVGYKVGFTSEAIQSTPPPTGASSPTPSGPRDDSTRAGLSTPNSNPNSPFGSAARSTRR